MLRGINCISASTNFKRLSYTMGRGCINLKRIRELKRVGQGNVHLKMAVDSALNTRIHLYRQTAAI